MRLLHYQKLPSFSPRASAATLHDEMDRLFEAAFPTLGDRLVEVPVDLYQDKDAYNVRAELPGFRKEELSLDLNDGTLTITGQQNAETKAEGADAKPTGQERRVSRALALPEDVDVEKIRASYENGVLTVTLPKREEVKPKQIAIEVK
jgi:HSP20 family protein